MGMRFRRIKAYWNKPEHVAYLFLAPAGILLLVFCILPLIASFGISLLKMGVDFRLAEFVGIDNYRKAPGDCEESQGKP